MHVRSLLAALLLMAISFTLSGQVAAQDKWVVEKTFHIGGEGGWDYITVDSANHRLYVPRSTHTMVIDADSGKTIGDIPGQNITMEWLWFRRPVEASSATVTVRW